MRKQIALSAAVALGVVSAPVLADGFSYSNVEASFVMGDTGDLDGGEGSLDASGDGIMLAGSAEFSDNVFGFVSFGTVTLDDIEVDGTSVGGKVKMKPLSVGLGVNLPISGDLDFVTGLSYERLEASASAGLGTVSAHVNGVGLSAGLRGRMGEKLELAGSLKYLDFDTKEFLLTVGGRYYVTNALAVGIDFSKYDDNKLTNWGLTLRYDVGAE